MSKGAVMKGLGLLTEKPPAIARSPCFYGVKTRQHFSNWRNSGDNVETDSLGVRWATDQIKWFVKKNDAILPGQDRVATYKCHWLLQPKDFETPSTTFSFSSRKRNSSHNKTDGHQPPPVYRDIVFVISSEEEAPTRYKELNMGMLSNLCISAPPPFLIALLTVQMPQRSPFCTATCERFPRATRSGMTGRGKRTSSARSRSRSVSAPSRRP